MTGGLALAPPDDLLPARRQALLFSNLLVGLLCLSYVWALPELPGVQGFEFGLFAAAGLLLPTLALLLRRGWLSYLWTALLSLAVMAALLLERLVMVFLGSLLDDPAQSIFMPVFSYYILLYISIVVLLPWPLSLAAGLAVWLLMAGLTTVLSLPQWQLPTPRPLLHALLLFVWLGHGCLVLLIFSGARMQQRLLRAQARAAAAEGEAREAAQYAWQTLAQQQQRLRFHVENTPLAAIEWSPDQRLQGWSPRAEAIFGWSAGEVLGRPLSDLGLIDDEALHAVVGQAGTAGAGPMQITQGRCRNRRGALLHCCWYSSRLFDEQGRLCSVFALIEDMSADHEAAQRLRQSETLLRGLIDQAGVGIALLDAGGRWLSVNQRFCEISGRPGETLLRLDPAAIAHPEDRPQLLDLSRRLLRGELPGYRCEARYQRPDGSLQWVVLNVRRIEAEAGQPVHYLQVIEDIGGLKASQASVQALNASLESRVGQRTAQLREAIADAERRGADFVRIAEMTGLLASARDLDEAMRIVAHSTRELFPHAELALYLQQDEAERFVLRESLGAPVPPVAGFVAADCWAIRRGREHRVEDEHDSLRCAHCRPGERHRPQTCLPLVALGETVGMLSLVWAPRPDGWAPDALLLRSVVEQVGLGLGNVRLRERLRRQGLRDPVTGLGSRPQLEEHLRRRAAEQARTGRGFCLLRIDIPDYPELVERHGLEPLERLSRQIADRLRAGARAEEPLFRHGPGEFALVLLDDDPQQAQRAAARLQTRGQLADSQEPSLPAVALRIAIAGYPRDADSVPQLLARAGQRLVEMRGPVARLEAGGDRS